VEFIEGPDGEAYCKACKKYSDEWNYKGVYKNEVLDKVKSLIKED
jgi:hypothetical protein